LSIQLRLKSVANTSEEKVQPSVTDKQPEAAAPSGKSSQKTISALAVFALGLNAAAAVYTSSPSDFVLPDVSRLAELLPHEKTRVQVPEAVVAALKDIQSAQQQHLASLQESSSSLEQNTGLLQQNSITIGSLRQSITDGRTDMKKISAQITDEHVDVKKISAQIASLSAKIDSLQSAIAPEITSSIPKGRARNRLSEALHKRMARQPKPLGPVSVGGAPLSFPVTAPAPES
jgi:type I site-specific restriction endonuclease